MSKKLPILLEKTLAEVKALQSDTGLAFHETVSNTSSRLTCKKGCANCCYHPLLISLVEGILLYRNLVGNGKWSPGLKKRLRDHRDRVRGLAFEVWLLSMTPCPLLKDDLCEGYASRPIHCRTTYSTRKAVGCHPHTLGEGLVYNTTVVAQYNLELSQLLKRAEEKSPLMPISDAVLLGERVSNQDLTFSEAVQEYLQGVSDA